MIDPRHDEDIDRGGLAALVARSEGDPVQPHPADPQPTPVGGVPIVEGLRSTRAHPWRRRIFRTAALLVVAGVVYYGVTLFQVWTVGRSDQARPVDAIVVMGAAQYDGTPSPLLAARLDHVVTLWGDGVANVVVVTGGNQPGDRFTEASASAAYLEDHGVPADAILQENASHNSYDSLVGVRDILRSRGWSRVLLVSDPFHSLRIRLISQELGLTAYVSPTRTSPVQGRTAYAREAKEAAGIAVARIIGFRRLLSITG